MKTFEVSAHHTETALRDLPQFDVVLYIPMVHKSKYRQRCHIIDLRATQNVCLELDLEVAAETFNGQCDRLKKQLGIRHDFYPYGFSAKSWPGYCLAPHGYLPLGGGDFQVGLNLYGRFLRMDGQSLTARLIDPEIKDAFLSTSNAVDPDTRKQWFASWAMEDTFQRALDPEHTVEGNIWRYSPDSQSLEHIWAGVIGDSLHQLTLSPDGHFVVLCEFGLYPTRPFPIGSFKDFPEEWTLARQYGLRPSVVLVLDLQEGREWRLSLPAAGHVEFDPLDPAICYLSSHNIGIIHGKVCIFGPASIHRYRLGAAGPRKIGEFSSKDFFRITTHVAFRHRNRTLIAVTGYPDTIFLVDGQTMEIYKKIRIANGERVSLGGHPHSCNQDSYGLTPSADGEWLFVGETGRFSVINIHSGLTGWIWGMNSDKNNWCYTGHIYRHSLS